MSAFVKRYRQWLVAVAAIILIGIVWRVGPMLMAVALDPSMTQAYIAELGWFGPVALVATNALQIVIAPIPGYLVQVAAGYLYGPFWGGVWGSLGLLVGATLAFWLARIYGRPIAERMVGRSRLDRWESVTHSTSTIVWFFMLLGPFGDAPYYLAGLSRVAFAKILIITSVLRIPSVFFAAAAGGGLLQWWQLVLVGVPILVIALLFFRYRDKLTNWFDRQIHRRISSELGQDNL